MKKKRHMRFVNIMAVLLFPYLTTIFVNGYDTAVLKRKPELEKLLPVILESQISSDHEMETLKAQAVIARSNLYRKLGENEKGNMDTDKNDNQNERNNIPGICRELCEEIPAWWKLWEKSDSVYEEAVKDTSGQVLTADGELKLVPYHEISAGHTRDGKTAFHDEEYTYLAGVDSSADKNAPDYLNSTYIMKQQLPEELKIAEREDSGYVVSLMADEDILEAESFVRGMGIASADFSMQKSGDQIRFLSKGKGHGLGFSQYGGNQLAKEGKSWQEILHTYFPLMEVTDVNGLVE